MGNRITINPLALERALHSPQMQAALVRRAQEVANAVRAQGIKVGDVNGGGDDIPLPVNVYENNDGTPGAIVVLSHAAGLAVQAKHGVLTKAAAQVGLDVTGGGQ